MREIKFRAWEKHEKRIMPHEGIKKFSEEVRKNLFGGIEKKFELLVLINSDDVELMQYTGLKDSNGVEIYEGDIIMGNGNKEELYEVKFGNFCIRDIETEDVIDSADGWYTKVIETDSISKCEPFCYDMPLNKSYVVALGYVVVGNVYENKELLKKI